MKEKFALTRPYNVHYWASIETAFLAGLCKLEMIGCLRIKGDNCIQEAESLIKVCSRCHYWKNHLTS